MDFTKREIISQEIGIGLDASLLTPMDVGECLRVMDVYAKQEALSFANWLSNQVIDGRTINKLWNDYQRECAPSIS